MRRLAGLAVGLTVLVAALTGCSGTTPDPEAQVDDAVEAFLADVEAQRMNETCARFTADLLARLDPPGGGCRNALMALARFTGAGDENEFLGKKIATVEVDGEVAVVTLVDRITGEAELPVRLQRVDEAWLIDDFGDGAKLAGACLDERTRVQDAIDRYFSDKDAFPPDTESLVPSYLPERPANHDVAPDGEITTKGVCA